MRESYGPYEDVDCQLDRADAVCRSRLYLSHERALEATRAGAAG